jgi:transcriptional regulator with XRE-family HTH domain
MLFESLERLNKEGGLMKLGYRLKRLRLQRGLTQEELADRCELSKGFISQVERDLTSPSIESLSDMLECLGSNLKNFFADEKEQAVVFTPNDMFEKVDEELLKGSILWLVPNAQKNSMEPILVSMNPGGKTQVMPGHEGEEFGYVLKGTVVLKIGEKNYKLSQGSSFSVHPVAEHYLENTGKRLAQVLWVSTPPIF